MPNIKNNYILNNFSRLDNLPRNEYAKNTSGNGRNQKNHIDFTNFYKFLAIQNLFLDSLFLNLTNNFTGLKFI